MVAAPRHRFHARPRSSGDRGANVIVVERVGWKFVLRREPLRDFHGNSFIEGDPTAQLGTEQNCFLQLCGSLCTVLGNYRPPISLRYPAAVLTADLLQCCG